MRNHIRRLILFLCVLALGLGLSACAGSGDAQETGNPLHLSAPEPSGMPEEDLILRRPDQVGDPADYPAWEPPKDPDDPDSTEGTASDTKEPAPPPAPKETRLSFVAVGDNVLHGAVMDDARRHAKDGAEYDFRYIYDPVRDVISAADVAFINQETPMGGKELGYYGYPNFNGPQEAGDALVDCGFDIVCVATNHMADLKDAGLIGTIKYWQSQPVTLIGGFLSRDEYDVIRVHEKDGVKIALLAYTYGTNGMSVSASSGLVIPLINEEDIRRQTALAKEVGDLVVVNMHWGDDSSFAVNALQKKYAQILADCGVDVIIGEHPHVLQPMGWIEGKDGNRTLLTYSIGNFVSTMYNDYFMVGGMLSFDIVKTEEGTHVEHPMLYPTMTYYDVNRSNLAVYFLSDVTEELVSSHGTNAHGATSLEKMRSYVTNAIPKEFLPEGY